MRDDNAAVPAGTDAQPHMTVHAEDIAGTERGRLLQAVAAVLTGKVPQALWASAWANSAAGAT